jgi:hypothetical protein
MTSSDAVLDSQVALDLVVADWTSSYERSPDEAMLDLTNFLIRCCGCKQFISAADFGNQDEMVETLENVLIRYKEVQTDVTRRGPVHDALLSVSLQAN